MEAERLQPEPPPADAGRGALGFALTFVDGQGVLALHDRPLRALARVDRLELEVPDLRFPFDLSGGVARFRHRRCRLRDLLLSVGTEELRAFAAQS